MIARGSANPETRLFDIDFSSGDQEPRISLAARIPLQLYNTKMLPVDSAPLLGESFV
jgi:hypothetical protein